MAKSVTMGGGDGVPGHKFNKVGDLLEGEIIDLEERQAIDIDSNEPIFWPDGKPKMEIVVTLETPYMEGEGIDPEKFNGEDDGKRRIWLRSNLFTAVRTAVKEAGASSLDVGGVLKIKFDSLGEKKKAAWQAPKLFKAKYTVPPPASVSFADEKDDF